ncbi:hypothetical protein [Ruminococcus sp.]|nr:hypothetical protein [Ruminococcus sp.]MBQ6250165.1 hypothetical protein [Ruminococcus sp.]
MVPYSPRKSEDKVYYKCVSSDMKVVSDYTLLDFSQIDGLEVFDYYGYLHDAVVWNCSRSEAGRDYLEDAYMHSRTEPDRAALKNIK